MGQPFQDAVEGGDLAGEAEDGQAVKAGGQEPGVGRGTSDALGMLDAVDDVLTAGGVQGWRGEGPGARNAGRGDGQASGEHGFGEPLGHLPGAGVPGGQQQHGCQRRPVQDADVGEWAAAGEVHVRPR